VHCLLSTTAAPFLETRGASASCLLLRSCASVFGNRYQLLQTTHPPIPKTTHLPKTVVKFPENLKTC
jgi:hypothetical protein